MKNEHVVARGVRRGWLDRSVALCGEKHGSKPWVAMSLENLCKSNLSQKVYSTCPVVGVVGGPFGENL